MGLLDGNLDPQSIATLQLAAGLLSPGSFGQGLGRGLTGYQNSLGAAQEMQMRKAQMDDAAAQAVLRQQQAQREQAKYNYFMGGATPPGPSAASSALGAGAQAGSVGPTMDNAARMGATPASPRFGGVP